ncbi:unnamed protein product [Heterobilharzia americana]|nr:unnamed protein product [Heterobilharzia americana]
MNESSQDTLEERYEMLKNLCRQQIVINETLKSEISKLNNIIRVVSDERSLLLDELINNHTSCRNTIKSETKNQKSLVQTGNKRAVSMSENEYQGVKKVKNDPSTVDRNEELIPRSDSSSSLPLNPISVQENEDQWNLDDQAQKNRCLTASSHSQLMPSTKFRLHYQMSPKTNMPVASAVGDVETSRRVLSTSNTTLKSNLSNPGSPPTITSNTHLIASSTARANTVSVVQRPNRGGSLVTNSPVSTQNSSIPFVSFTSQRSTVGSQSKYMPVANHPLKVVSSGNVNNTASNILKSVTSPPISPGIRLSVHRRQINVS